MKAIGDIIGLLGVYRVLPNMGIAIPKGIADKWGLKPKDKLVIYYDPENDRLVIESGGGKTTVGQTYPIEAGGKGFLLLLMGTSRIR